MSGFLLDTNVLSEFNRTGPPDERVKQWLTSITLDSLYVSVVTLGEIQFGIELLPSSKRRTYLEQWVERDFNNWFEGRILPVDDEVVIAVGITRGRPPTSGQPAREF